jgi:hypothetical protein
MARLIVALALLMGLAACDDSRCPADQVPKATEAYGACLQIEQQGTGGKRLWQARIQHVLQAAKLSRCGPDATPVDFPVQSSGPRPEIRAPCSARRSRVRFPHLRGQLRIF